MATSKRERQKAARREKLARLQAAQQRRKRTRQIVITVIVAALVIGSAALIFGGSSSTTTTTTMATTTTTMATTTTTAATTTTSASSSATTSPSTTTTMATTTTASSTGPTQAQANAIAVAAGCPASTSTKVNNLTWSSAPKMSINSSLNYYAHFKTTAGDFVVQLDAKNAPITTNNFVFLAQHNYYHCVIFHRAIPGFMIQGGDPTGTGTGGPGYTIADEYPKTASPQYPLYSIAMANTGSPHTGGSQFFIVTGATGESLPPQYSLFGQVVSGTNAVMAINNEGNSSPSSNGVPPIVTNRILSITISNSAN